MPKEENDYDMVELLMPDFLFENVKKYLERTGALEVKEYPAEWRSSADVASFFVAPKKQ